LFQVCAVIGAFATPVVINRLGGALPAFLLNGALWASLPLGLLLAPDLWALWSALGGVAQGGGFVCVFTVVVLRARTLPENRQLSAVVQTGGYTIACLAPVIIGGLHESTGAWSAPLLAAALAIAVLTVLGALSTRGIRR
jgi:CP family cyanate transporter-like MFS transporter